MIETHPAAAAAAAAEKKQPSRLPYASLSEIRRAIQRRRVIRFHHQGSEVTTEPHLLGKGTRTGAYYVKGYDSRVRGPFVLASECAGEGCPTPPVMCLFGTTYRELLASTAFEGELSTRVTPGDSTR